jgi:BirA family transcriptional regulator, biotin operon repressor / biotin---[acetyl-CoA-carboxylase] ligase
LRGAKNSNLLPIGHSFIELESVDSTNNYAMGKVHAGSASHGAIFFAHEQWAGKGQRGRSWTSAPGGNITMSVVLEPVFLTITRQFSLSAAVALACHDLFSHYAGNEQTSIKWPNDLYWRDRKAGGILIENSFRGDQWLSAIAGIGININQVQFPDDLRNPVSLRQISGRSFDAVALAKELGQCLERRYEQLRAEMAGSGIPGNADEQTPCGESGAVSLLEAYNARLYKRGTTARLKKDQAVFETTIQGVSPAGELLTRDSLERRFNFGEVEWLG